MDWRTFWEHKVEFETGKIHEIKTTAITLFIHDQQKLTIGISFEAHLGRALNFKEKTVPISVLSSICKVALKLSANWCDKASPKPVP